MVRAVKQGKQRHVPQLFISPLLIQRQKEKLLANCELSPRLLKSVPHYSSFPPTHQPPTPSTGAMANIVIRIENPNHYAISFTNLVAEVFDYDGNLLGTVNQDPPERFQVNKRSSEFMQTMGAFRASLPQVGMVGVDCLNNNGMTLVQIRTAADFNYFGGSRRVFRTASERVQCTVRNVVGGGNAPGRWTPAPGAVAPFAPVPGGNAPMAPFSPGSAPAQPRPVTGAPNAPFPQAVAPFQPAGPPRPGAAGTAPFQPGGASGAFPPQSPPFPPGGNVFPPGVGQMPGTINQNPIPTGQPMGNGFGGAGGGGGGVRGWP